MAAHWLLKLSATVAFEFFSALFTHFSKKTLLIWPIVWKSPQRQLYFFFGIVYFFFGIVCFAKSNAILHDKMIKLVFIWELRRHSNN